jgi:hypothetical protein
MRLYTISVKVSYPIYIIKKDFHIDMITIRNIEELKTAYIQKGILYDDKEQVIYCHRNFDVFASSRSSKLKSSIHTEITDENITKHFS